MTTSTKSLAIRGVLFNYMGRGCSIFITFFLTPFLVVTLGNERYGLWAIVMSLTGYYALADLGMRSAGTKYIASAHAQDDYRKVNEIIVSAMGMYIAMAVVVLTIGGIVASFFPVMFEVPGEKHTVMQAVVLLLTVNFAVRLLGQPFGSTLTALARFDLSNGIAIVSQLASAIAMVVALNLETGLLGMAAATLTIGFLTQTMTMTCARRVIPSLSLSRKHFNRTELGNLFSFSAGVIFINGVRRVSQYGAPLIIGFILGPAAVAFYAIADALIQKGSGLTNGLSKVVMPLTSRLDALGNRNALMQMAILVNRLMQTASLFLLTTFSVFGNRLVTLWINAEYAEHVYPILCVLAVANVATTVSGGIPSTLMGLNQLRPLRIVAIVEGVLSLACGLTLTYMYGLLGMAAAVLIARFITYTLLLPTIAAKQLDRPRIELLVQSNAPALIASCPTAVLCIGLEYAFPATSLWMLVGQLVLAGIVAVIAAFFLCVPRWVRASIFESLSLRRRGSSPDEQSIIP